MMRPFRLAVALLAVSLSARAVAATPQLTLEDVQTIFAQSVSRAVNLSPNAVIAVVDREGFVLGVWDVAGRLGGGDDPLVSGQFSVVGGAVREAGSASYLSSDQNAFTSRTAQFIIQQNFPPGVRNRPPGPLVGVEFSNAPYSDVNRFRRLDVGPNGELPGKPGSGFVADSLGTGIPNTRLSGRSGSAPLYKDDKLVGGIGVFTADTDSFLEIGNAELRNEPAGNRDGETIALAGQVGFAPRNAILASNVTIDGIRVPYVLGQGKIKNLLPFDQLPGRPVVGYSLHASPPLFPFPKERLGGQNVEIRFPIRADPMPGLIRGQPRLTEEEVRAVIARASDRARTTRAGIRLPVGVSMQAWLTVVGNPNQDGTPAPILAIARTPGATFFSFDVALQKARTALFFSSDKMAMTSRTVGFLAQNYYPPGLEGKAPGPFGPNTFELNNPATSANDVNFDTVGQQIRFTLPLLPLLPPGVAPNANAFIAGPPNPNLPNGITVFPGGFPLYRNGVLIGAVGISGDGVDQDDIVGASASGDELAPPREIRADRFTYDGARLPYAKFPRNPER
jgi:uncharacterized protein GlcG (DUF336 family)